MLERLLELFLHAKAGAIAGVLILGTTGALVTATVATSGNVTTITLTQASERPLANVELKSPAASPRTPKPTPTEEPSSSPSNATTTTSATTCTPDQNANAAVKTVDTAFTMYHTDLMHLRTDGNKGDAGKSIIATADKQLKQIRQDAVKAIHAAASCKTDTKESDDEDKTEQDDNDKTEKDIEDQNDDNDPTSTARSTGTDSNLLVVFFNNLFGKHGTTTPTTTTPTTTTTTTVTGDAQTLADNAVAAMKLVFNTAKSDLDKLTTTNATPKQGHSPEHSNTTKGDKGKGHSGDHEGGDD